MRSITSRSYIVFNGKRRYLENSVGDIEFHLSLRGDSITLRESTLMTWREFTIKKAAIQEYGTIW